MTLLQKIQNLTWFNLITDLKTILLGLFTKTEDTNLNYSTAEVLTGGTWIDGKPIYRKVIESTTLDELLQNIDVTSLNIENLTEPIRGLIQVNSNKIAVPYTTIVDAVTVRAIMFNTSLINNNTLRVSYYSVEENEGNNDIIPLEGYNYNLILEYTKTI